MSKNIPAEHGLPVDVVFDYITRTLPSQRQWDPNDLDEILTTTRGFINSDVCFTDSQIHSLRHLLGVRLAAGRSSYDLLSLATELATLINSFNLQCTNCTTMMCPKSDPHATRPKKR